MCDLTWADPIGDDDEANELNFRENKSRECSFFYGKKPVKKLLKQNNLVSIFRAHQV